MQKTFHRMGGSVIMKGQKENRNWMHLITYIEKRDTKTYIGNRSTVHFP